MPEGALLSLRHDAGRLTVAVHEDVPRDGAEPSGWLPSGCTVGCASASTWRRVWWQNTAFWVRAEVAGTACTACATTPARGTPPAFTAPAAVAQAFVQMRGGGRFARVRKRLELCGRRARFTARSEGTFAQSPPRSESRWIATTCPRPRSWRAHPFPRLSPAAAGASLADPRRTSR